MVNATAMNPGVITSLDGGVGSGSDQPVQVYPPPDVVLPNIPSDAQSSPILQTPPAVTTVFQSPATKPKISLPDISQIEQQLKACGALISDIPEQVVPDTSPLAHLQPNAAQPSQPNSPQSSQPTTATDPFYAQPSPIVPLAPIKLASTAPTKTTLTIPNTPPSGLIEEEPGFFSHVIKWSITGVSLVAVVVMGMMAYQNFVLKDGNTDLRNMFTQFAGQSDYVEVDEETGAPKAVWYQ